MNALQAFRVRLTALAGMCNHTLTPDMIALYERNLSVMGYDAVVAALDEVITRRRSRDAFPSIRELIELIQPEADPEAEAVEAASRIIHAVSRIGPYRPQDARVLIGELGWLVVEREGGWTRICESLTDDNLTTMRAQWRQIALAQYRRAKAGVSGAPALPTPDGKVIGMDLKKLLPEMPR